MFLRGIIFLFRPNKTLRASIQIKLVCSSQIMSCARLNDARICFFVSVAWISEKKTMKKSVFNYRSVESNHKA